MKKLNKLQINPERLMKNEELTTLRGGYGSIKCYSEGWIPGCMGYLGTVQGDCGNWQSECFAGGFHAYCAEC
jgi:hypothetical protein